MTATPGWYPDPEDPAQSRYWNGGAWTDQRTPRMATPPPTYAVPPAATHGPATTSLVLGIVGLVACGLFTGIPAMVIGLRARREIDASRGRLGGRGVATAGFWTGLVATVWTGLVTLAVIGVFAFGGAVSEPEEECTVRNADGTTSPCGVFAP